MNKIKKLFSTLLALILTFGCFSSTVLASTTSISNKEIIDFEVNSNDIDQLNLLNSKINQSFYMTTYHKGASRNYSGNNLRFTITITDSNGNPVNNILAIRLYDSNSSVYLREYQYWANGSTNVAQGIPISPNKNYYFEYLLAYGNITTFKVHMIIETY